MSLLSNSDTKVQTEGALKQAFAAQLEMSESSKWKHLDFHAKVRGRPACFCSFRQDSKISSTSSHSQRNRLAAGTPLIGLLCEKLLATSTNEIHMLVEQIGQLIDEGIRGSWKRIWRERLHEHYSMGNP